MSLGICICHLSSLRHPPRGCSHHSAESQNLLPQVHNPMRANVPITTLHFFLLSSLFLKGGHHKGPCDTNVEPRHAPCLLLSLWTSWSFLWVLLFSQSCRPWVLHSHRNSRGLQSKDKLQWPWVKDKNIASIIWSCKFFPTEEFRVTVTMGWAVPLKMAYCPPTGAPVVLPRCPSYSRKWKIMATVGK